MAHRKRRPKQLNINTIKSEAAKQRISCLEKSRIKKENIEDFYKNKIIGYGSYGYVAVPGPDLYDKLDTPTPTCGSKNYNSEYSDTSSCPYEPQSANFTKLRNEENKGDYIMNSDAQYEELNTDNNFGGMNNGRRCVVYKSVPLRNLHTWIRETCILNYLNNPGIITTNEIQYFSGYVLNKGKSTTNMEEDVCITNEKEEKVNIFMKRYYYNLMNIDTNLLTDYDILFILFKLASAINHMHFNKIIHRDLTENNILLEVFDPPEVHCPRGSLRRNPDSHTIFRTIKSVKLCDFGMSRYVEPDKSSQTEFLPLSPKVCATSHRPPEITKYNKILKQKKTKLKKMFSREWNGPLIESYDHKVDIWCFGMVIFTLLTGKTLYEYFVSSVIKKEESPLVMTQQHLIEEIMTKSLGSEVTTPEFERINNLKNKGASKKQEQILTKTIKKYKKMYQDMLCSDSFKNDIVKEVYNCLKRNSMIIGSGRNERNQLKYLDFYVKLMKQCFEKKPQMRFAARHFKKEIKARVLHLAKTKNFYYINILVDEIESIRSKQQNYWNNISKIKSKRTRKSKNPKHIQKRKSNLFIGNNNDSAFKYNEYEDNVGSSPEESSDEQKDNNTIIDKRSNNLDSGSTISRSTNTNLTKITDNSSEPKPILDRITSDDVISKQKRLSKSYSEYDKVIFKMSEKHEKMRRSCSMFEKFLKLYNYYLEKLESEGIVRFDEALLKIIALACYVITEALVLNNFKKKSIFHKYPKWVKNKISKDRLIDWIKEIMRQTEFNALSIICC